jgi:hypothetical protein
MGSLAQTLLMSDEDSDDTRADRRQGVSAGRAGAEGITFARLDTFPVEHIQVEGELDTDAAVRLSFGRATEMCKAVI